MAGLLGRKPPRNWEVRPPPKFGPVARGGSWGGTASSPTCLWAAWGCRAWGRARDAGSLLTGPRRLADTGAIFAAEDRMGWPLAQGGMGCW